MPLLATDVRTWTLYKIINPDNEVYVGRTSDFKSRMSAYRTLGSRTEKIPLLYQSLVKYGFNAHKIEILETFESTRSRSEGKEIFWVRTNMSNRNKWPEMKGLNLADGGQGSRGMVLSEERKQVIGNFNRGKPMSDEQKKKLSDYGKANPSMGFLGKHHTDENKKVLSLLKKGKPSPHIGKKMSDEQKIKISLAKKGKSNTKLKGRKFSEEIKAKIYLTRNTVRKPMLLEKDGVIQEFYSERAVCRFLGIGKGLLKSIMKGFLDYKYNGYTLKYKQ